MDKVTSLLLTIKDYFKDKQRDYEKIISQMSSTSMLEHSDLLRCFKAIQHSYDELFKLFSSLEKNKQHLTKLSINLEKKLMHNHNGMWFHPRELISDKMLITSGHNGIIKTWDIPSFKLHKEINTYSQWVTSIKYDPSTKLIFIGSYSELLQIYKYDEHNNDIYLVDQIKLNLLIIYGIDARNGLLACGGCSECKSKTNITLYTYVYSDIGEDFNIHYNQIIQPFKKISLNSIDRKEEGVSKSLRFSQDSSLLFAGYSNGIIETYAIDVVNHMSTMIYYLILDKADFVYQMQILNDRRLFVTNGNLLYLIEFDQLEIKVISKKTFFSSINDFNCFTLNGVELIGIKLKTGNIIFYLPSEDKIISEIDESCNRGVYDNCLLIMNETDKKYIMSGRDNEMIIYSYSLI